MSTYSITGTIERPAESIQTAMPPPLPPQVFEVQGITVSPSMPIADKLQDTWRQEIQPRLAILLQQNIPSGTCVQEFMMAGKRPKSLKPTVILTCGNSQTKNGVKKLVKHQNWLREILQVNNIAFIALVAKISLSARSVSEPNNAGAQRENFQTQVLESTTGKPCGLPIRITFEDDYQRYCTLGGLLMVHDQIVGLTAGHPFLRGQQLQPAFGQSPEDGEDRVVLEEGEGSETSSQPYIMEPEECSDERTLFSSEMPASPGIIDSTKSIFYKHFDFHDNYFATAALGDNWSQSVSVFHPLLNLISGGLGQHCDWALLENMPNAMTVLSNKFTFSEAGPEVFVEDTVSELHQAEVFTIMSNNDVVPGRLYPSPAGLNINGLNLNVQLLILEHVAGKRAQINKPRAH